MAKFYCPPFTSFSEANQILGNRTQKKIANNTLLVRLNENEIAVRLHYTDVVTFLRDGKIRLNSGGFWTATTKERINHCLNFGFRVYQQDFNWYLRTPLGFQPFTDGMEFLPTTAFRSIPGIQA
jgi:hypothetical protein